MRGRRPFDEKWNGPLKQSQWVTSARVDPPYVIGHHYPNASADDLFNNYPGNLRFTNLITVSLKYHRRDVQTKCSPFIEGGMSANLAHNILKETIKNMTPAGEDHKAAVAKFLEKRWLDSRVDPADPTYDNVRKRYRDPVRKKFVLPYQHNDPRLNPKFEQTEKQAARIRAEQNIKKKLAGEAMAARNADRAARRAEKQARRMLREGRNSAGEPFIIVAPPVLGTSPNANPPYLKDWQYPNASAEDLFNNYPGDLSGMNLESVSAEYKDSDILKKCLPFMTMHAPPMSMLARISFAVRQRLLNPTDGSSPVDEQTAQKIVGNILKERKLNRRAGAAPNPTYDNVLPEYLEDGKLPMVAKYEMEQLEALEQPDADDTTTLESDEQQTVAATEKSKESAVAVEVEVATTSTSQTKTKKINGASRKIAVPSARLSAPRSESDEEDGEIQAAREEKIQTARDEKIRDARRAKAAKRQGDIWSRGRAGRAESRAKRKVREAARAASASNES